MKKRMMTKRTMRYVCSTPTLFAVTLLTPLYSALFSQSDDDSVRSNHPSAPSKKTSLDLFKEMEVLVDTITSILHGPDKLTPEEINQIVAPYLALRSRLDTLFKELNVDIPGFLPPTPKKGRKSGGGGKSGSKSGGKSNEGGDHDELNEPGETTDQRLDREANAEVRLLGFTYHKIPISQQLESLYQLIRKDLDQLKNSSEDTSNMKHDSCHEEIKALVQMDATLNKMILAVKYRMGVIFACHERQSDVACEPFNRLFEGRVFTNWRDYYAKAFSITSKEIEQLMRFAEHVNMFPGLINSDKGWSWMKEHMRCSRLQTKIQMYYAEKWETIQDVNERASISKMGYDMEKYRTGASSIKADPVPSPAKK
jgi:hypothetical protein